MEIRRSPGAVITVIGIGLALLTVFGSDLPFAPSSMFLPFMMILVGRAVSRGAKAGKSRQRPTPTIFKMPPTVPPPARTPKPQAKQAPRPAPVEVVVEEPAAPTEPGASELEERLRVAQAEARKTRSKPEPPPAPEPAVRPPIPAVVPSPSRGAVYPSPTPSSSKARSSKEMVEEAKKRIKRG